MLRAGMDHRSEANETGARYTFGVADNPEMLEEYAPKTSFRSWVIFISRINSDSGMETLTEELMGKKFQVF